MFTASPPDERPTATRDRGSYATGVQKGPFLSPRQVADRLRAAELRPTRQRLVLARFLFGDEHRHVTAGDVQRFALSSGVRVSLATIYNTLNQFADAGLIRKLSVTTDKAYYDTDPSSHQHFYVEDEDLVIDIPAEQFKFGRLPLPPRGYVIASVDVVIRLRRE